MARVALTPTVFQVNGAVADPTGTTLVSGTGNGVQVSPAPRSLLFRVNNPTAGSATVTILAGTQPLANESGLGALTVTVAAAGVEWVGPFESARFEQSDGSIIVESSAAVVVAGFDLDRRRF
jgi:hypothetical protein